MEQLLYDDKIISSVNRDSLEEEQIVCSVEEGLLKKLRYLRKKYKYAKEKELINKLLEEVDENYNDYFDTICVTTFKSHYRIGALADTHVGKNFEERGIFEAYDIFNNQDVDFVIHSGDITDGISYRIKDKYEQQQRFEEIQQFIANDYPNPGFKTYLAGGNHDSSLIRCGYDLVDDILSYRDDIVFGGYNLVNMYFNDLWIQVIHESGKLFDSSEIDTVKSYIKMTKKDARPNVLLNAHLHQIDENRGIGGVRFIKSPALFVPDPKIYILDIFPQSGNYKINAESYKLERPKIYSLRYPEVDNDSID